MENKFAEGMRKEKAEQAEVSKKNLPQPSAENRAPDEERFRQKVADQQETDEQRQDKIRESLGLPVREKRFKLGKEDFALERQRAVKDSIREMQEENPEVLSFCMFGSMTKGKAKLASDIDGFLFVDAEKVGEKFGRGSVREGVERKKDDFGSQSKKDFSKFDDALEEKYARALKDKIKQKSNLSDEQLEDIKVLPISREIIDQQLESFKKSLEEPERYETQTPSFLNENEMVTMENEVLPIVSDNFSKMFHLESGGGIREYRKYLIDRLGSMGETGEKIWKEIIDSTATMEHGSLSVARYPETLQEARDIYGK